MKTFFKYSVLTAFAFFVTYFIADWFSQNYFIKTNFNGCVDCHDEMTGFEESHTPDKVGCDACHLGNPNTTNKNFAHKGMILIPGNLSDASKTCGVVGCHPGIPERINNSLMNTMSGVISVNRFTFDEIEKPEGLFKVKDLTQSNADNHNRNLCASCHLGNEKTEFGPINELSRGGGCNACHLNYSNEAMKQLEKYQNSASSRSDREKLKIKNSKKRKDFSSEFPKLHPQLTLEITNNHCFGCHSRSGRISTNYEGWFETLLNWDEVKQNKDYRLLMDGRVFQKTEDDVHHKAGMECIDCHVSMEIMGDGNLYQHMDEQLKVQCVDCHSKEINSISYDRLEFESKKIVDLRKSRKDNEEFLVTEKNKIPLINTIVNRRNEKYLLTKSSNKKLSLNQPKQICIEGKSHQRLSCNTCHTEWVSHCVGCHTEYDPNLEGYDLLDNKDITGSWNETPSDFYIDYPVLGIRKEKSGKEVIEIFIPGMILTIDKFKNPQKKIFKRLFAPTFSHTINKEGRSCKSCHNDPLAIGYGKGKLEYSKNGNWIFTPHFENRTEDKLPKDAWIGFLKTRDETSTTRTITRPFTIEEQKRILLVGACLNCHDENSSVMKRSFIEFDVVLSKVTDNCVMPSY